MDPFEHPRKVRGIHPQAVRHRAGEQRARILLPQDLAPLVAQAGIDGTIAVPVRHSIEVTDWLLGLADAHPDLILGIVGWLPLRDRVAWIGEILDVRPAYPTLKGVRHVPQAENDDYQDDPAFNSALSELPERDRTYDLLVFARQLPHLSRPLVDIQGCASSSTTPENRSSRGAGARVIVVAVNDARLDFRRDQLGITGELTFNDPDFHRRELALLASRNARPAAFARIIELVGSGVLDTASWITHHARLEEVPAGFESRTRPETGLLKAMIEIGST